MKFESLGESCCRVEALQEGDIIPIGGASLGKFDLSVLV